MKELQKGLVVIDFQGDVTSNLFLSEEERLYDGSISYTSTMSETDMRNEIVRKNRYQPMNCSSLTRKILFCSMCE